jgi:hypothetical protein
VLPSTVLPSAMLPSAVLPGAMLPSAVCPTTCVRLSLRVKCKATPLLVRLFSVGRRECRCRCASVCDCVCLCVGGTAPSSVRVHMHGLQGVGQGVCQTHMGGHVHVQGSDLCPISLRSHPHFYINLHPHPAHPTPAPSPYPLVIRPTVAALPLAAFWGSSLPSPCSDRLRPATLLP